MLFPTLLALTAATLIASAIGTVMRARRTASTPRGKGRTTGGAALVLATATGWSAAALLGIAPDGTLAAAAVMLGLAALARQDRLRPIAALYRYAAQASATVVGLTFLPGAGHVFQGLLPVTLDLILSSLLWVGAMAGWSRLEANDGAWLAQAVAIGLGAALAGFLAGDPQGGWLATGPVLAAAALGSLPWIMPLGRLPLGLVGTLPTGFALGWVLLALAGCGHWGPALILPLRSGAAFGALVRREYRRRRAPAVGESLPRRRARSEAKADPSRVLAATARIDALLIALATLAVTWPWPALLLAIPVAAGLSGLPLDRIKPRRRPVA